MLHGIKMFNMNNGVNFTTEGMIERDDFRNNPDYQVVSFELKNGERIIGIRSHDTGAGFA
jgi:hypothetical protein